MDVIIVISKKLQSLRTIIMMKINHERERISQKQASVWKLWNSIKSKPFCWKNFWSKLRRWYVRLTPDIVYEFDSVSDDDSANPRV